MHVSLVVFIIYYLFIYFGENCAYTYMIALMVGERNPTIMGKRSAPRVGERNSVFYSVIFRWAISRILAGSSLSENHTTLGTGGIVFGGGLIGFLLSRNPSSLTTGGLLGGAIMAMGVLSLKVWRKGLSSLPFMLGQAALATTLLWKHLQVYSLTKKIFPSGFYVATSAAMLCFYSYVLISGGNPPPKKSAAVSLS